MEVQASYEPAACGQSSRRPCATMQMRQGGIGWVAMEKRVASCWRRSFEDAREGVEETVACMSLVQGRSLSSKLKPRKR